MVKEQLTVSIKSGSDRKKRQGETKLSESGQFQELGAEATRRPPDYISDDRVFLAWQRSHMANERTFLAWARTSISLLAFGFVIERFDLFLRHFMRLDLLSGATHGANVHIASSEHIVYLSLFSFFLAGFAILFSGMRFLAVRRNINQKEAVFSVVPDILVTISVVVIIVITIVLSLPRLFEIGK
jgi:putative membrane protein